MIEKKIIKIQNFTGPLDLLYTLIQNKKIDLFSINLLQLTNEYFEIIENSINEYDIEIISSYLVLAVNLIHLKTKLILKPSRQTKDSFKTTHQLIKKLYFYKQIKKISNELKNKSLIRQKMFNKKISSYEKFGSNQTIIKLASKGNPLLLIIALRKMFERNNYQKIKQTNLQKIHLSPEIRRNQLIKILKEHQSSFFEKFFHVPSINHFVLTWITVLDMAFKQEIILEQKTPFGQINIKKNHQIFQKEIENE